MPDPHLSTKTNSKKNPCQERRKAVMHMNVGKTQQKCLQGVQETQAVACDNAHGSQEHRAALVHVIPLVAPVLGPHEADPKVLPPHAFSHGLERRRVLGRENFSSPLLALSRRGLEVLGGCHDLEARAGVHREPSARPVAAHLKRLGSNWPHRPLWPGMALVTLRPKWPHGTPHTLGARGAIQTLRTLHALRSGVARRSCVSGSASTCMSKRAPQHALGTLLTYIPIHAYMSIMHTPIHAYMSIMHTYITYSNSAKEEKGETCQEDHPRHPCQGCPANQARHCYKFSKVSDLV